MAGERHRATCWEREGHSCGKAPKERCTVALLVNVEEHHEGHVGATSRGSDITWERHHVGATPRGSDTTPKDSIQYFRGIRQEFKGY